MTTPLPIPVITSVSSGAGTSGSIVAASATALGASATAASGPASQGDSMSRASMSRTGEILLVAGRELRTQLFKRSAIISTLVMTLLIVAGIIAVSILGGSSDEPYRLGVSGADSSTVTQLAPALEKLHTSDGQAVTVVDMSGKDAAAALSDDASDADRLDMNLDLAAQPALQVEESADDGVVAGVTALLQQQALASQVAALGGDASTVASAVQQAAPEVVALAPKDASHQVSGSQYATLMAIDFLLFLAIMGGGQIIAMGVVEEKSSRIVEILLACVRPTSLLAGKVLGTGVATIASYAAMGIIAVVTASITGVMPDASVDLSTTLVAMLVWMIVGFATMAVLFGAAGALVSRQEDVGNVTMPLTMLCTVPYMLSIFMMNADPMGLIWRVLSYVPVFSAFLMPARLVLGVSSWAEQGIALLIALAVLPLLIRAAATIYTRAVTRMGSRVPLREVLSRRAA